MRKSRLLKSLRTLALVAAVGLFAGCATMINGTKQKFELRSERPGVMVRLNRDEPVTLPATLALSRKQEGQMLRIITPPADSPSHASGTDTLRIFTRRRVSQAVWTNFMIGLYGIPGALVDMGLGGAWYIEPLPQAKIPSYIRIIENPDPWKSGTWRGSLGMALGVKNYPPDATHSHSRLGPDLALDMILGKKSWPVEAEARWYAVSSLDPVAFVIAETGVRKTWLTDSDYRPFASAGLAFINRSTQPHGGVPVGVYARGGVDLRPTPKFFLSPYLGYSKFELISASEGRNTGGITGGLLTGFLW